MLQTNKQTNKRFHRTNRGSGWLHNKLSDAAAGHTADPVSHHVCSFPFSRCRRTAHRLSLLVLGWPVVAGTERPHLPLLTLHLRPGLQALLRLRHLLLHT